MASSSKNSSKGVDGATPSRKGSKSKSSSLVAVESSDVPAEGNLLSKKNPRLTILKISTSRSAKLRAAKDSMASQTSETLSRGEGGVGSVPSSKDARNFRSFL